MRSLAPNAHLLVLDTAFDPQGQTWFQVQLPEGGLAFVADAAVEVQGSCANLPGVTLAPQAGSLPPSLCFIDPSKVAGSFSATTLDDYTVIANPNQANQETGSLLLNAAIVTVSQPVRATFTAQPLSKSILWSGSVPVATFLRVTIYDINFQQMAYQEVPLEQALNVDLPAGDYYWLFEMDTAGASLNIRCEPQPEQTSPGYMPICALFDSAPNGELINPRPIDKMPLVDGQDQPNEAAAYVLEYPFAVYQDTLLRVQAMGSSSVKAMLFIPSVQLYQSETTIAPGGYANIAVPQGVYTLEFFSSSPFDINALCWPGDTPPEALGTPEPSATVGEAIGFILGDCVAATGFGPDGAPLNPFSFDPMSPLTLDYWAPNENGTYFNDIKYLIAYVPVQVFFNTLGGTGTLNVYVYDIAGGKGAILNASYPPSGNYNLALPAGVFYMSFSSNVPGRAVVNCLPIP